MNSTLRIDKWLWAARFFKTRSLATHAVDLGRVQRNQARVKPAQELHIGDVLVIEHCEQRSELRVLRLLALRGSAAVAQTMYEETAASLEQRQQRSEERKYYREPAAVLPGRPSKRERRALTAVRDDY